MPEAARRVARDPETVRRWIRAGRLRARRVGTQHVIEEADLDLFAATKVPRLPLPRAWQRTIDGRAPLDWSAAVRGSRRGR